jgi:DNA-binding NarL/FixJ family response regulator
MSGVSGSEPQVLIAESDPATAAGIRMALQAAGIGVCGEVAEGQALLEAVARLAPDLCLIDVDLVGGGIAAAAEIRGRTTVPAIVMLANSDSEADFLEATRVGVGGYLLKSISLARLPKVIHAVLRGEVAIPRSLVGVLLDHVGERSARRHLLLPDRRSVELTSRESEVFDLLRKGSSTRQIAASLLISEVTVRRHIGGVLKKLQVESRGEALKLLQSA